MGSTFDGTNNKSIWTAGNFKCDYFTIFDLRIGVGKSLR